uniref:E3 ubiquitin protein ligase (EC) n=1 Tax=Ganoderma boninense TaxID=34458 RepID=A0A5K1JWY8_9APHY|nr:E3 ubiquitin protein ligase (EC [Ganoderma boninense]
MPSTSARQDEMWVNKELDAVKRELAEYKEIEEANCELALELEAVKRELALGKERHTKLQMSIAGIQEETSCGICGHQMTSAAILECGHTFCGSCVYTWFRTKLDDHVLEYPNYDPKSFVPKQWITALQDERLSWIARLSLVSNIDASLLSARHPVYTCPSCRQHVRSAPVPNVALKQVTRGLPESLDVDNGPNDVVEDVFNWEDLFPISVRQLGLVWYVIVLSSARHVL